MANFNFSSEPEYLLQKNLTEELINLYGILVKFLITEKINLDANVFGDYSHLKSDSTKIYDMYMLPENTEDWDSTGFNLTSFGLTNLENINLFVAKSNFTMTDHDEIKEIVGNLIVLPNNKIMEISNVELTVPGINNLFTFNDAKSVYKLSCVPYNFKLINELDNTDISADGETPYETLDNYFQDLVNIADAQNTEAEVTEQVQTVDQSEILDQLVDKPIVNNDEEDIWGQFN